MIDERMLYKLRKSPEDFVVEERINLKDGNGFLLYRLTKRNVDTLEAIRRIAKASKVPEGEIGYAGLKDRHSLSIQYITVPAGMKLREIQDDDLMLELVGEVGEHLSLGSHEGNEFTITLREMREKVMQRIISNMDFISRYPIPNYFDSQRFGSIRGSGRFMAEEIMRGEFERALRLCFYTYRKEHGRIKRLKREVLREWKNWKKCRKIAERTEFARAFEHLEQNPDDFRGALLKLGKQMLSLYISAYQSFLWNEILKSLIAMEIGMQRVSEVRYLAGVLYFLRKGNYDEFFRHHSKDIIPLPNPEMRSEFLDQILAARGFSIGDLNALDGFWRMTKPPRRAFVDVKDISIVSKGDGWLKLRFFLPPGSYATIVLKGLAAA